MSKRIIVTGGAGFIGANLCRRLLAAGHEVVCLDDFSSGQRRNVADLETMRGFTLLTGDVSEPLPAPTGQLIYNLACPASPGFYQADPVRTMRTSVLGALNGLELARRLGARILQASTSEIYGDPAVHPQPESYWGNVNPIGIRSCYDEGKRAAETLFFDYRRQYGVDTAIARIFNTYGPGMRIDDGRVVSNFIVQALRGEDITLFGDGTQTRSFCYVDDLVGGLIALMESGLPGPVNLGNPAEFTMLELAEAVLDVTGSASRLVYRPLPEDDPKQRRPDIGLATSALGWTPTVALRQGLERATVWFEARLREPTGR